MKITNLAGKKVSFKRYVNNNCLKMVDDLKLVKDKYPNFDMKEAFKIFAEVAYLDNVNEPRATLNRVDMLDLLDDKDKQIKMIGIKKD